MSGFIRLSRSFFENAYWKQKRAFSFSEAWLDLIQTARFEEQPARIVLSSGREITVGRGQLRASLRFLAERWGWGVDKTQRYINKHIERKEIERRTQQGETILTLCNYDKYNPLPVACSDTLQYNAPDTGPTPIATKNKNVKKLKEIKEYGCAESKRFTPPSPAEVESYISKNNYSVNGESFYDFYQSKGWMVGKNKMKDWRAAVRRWHRSSSSPGGASGQPATGKIYSYEEMADLVIKGIYLQDRFEIVPSNKRSKEWRLKTG